MSQMRCMGDSGPRDEDSQRGKGSKEEKGMSKLPKSLYDL
ncbi:MAG: hypothetical protein PWR00_781 [Thermovirga sp.]|nr:MAG: hypothetical protein XD70_0274 [Thermovirga lienii]MDN5318818.1 hypothetical protein [Thermovirga sp.]